MPINFIFPKTILVSEQEIDTRLFSENWKISTVSLAEKIVRKYISADKKRFIVAIGGPSGSSKSTTATLLKQIINEQTNYNVLQISLDGYHFSQKYLEEHYDIKNKPLVEHKGRYDSFDVVSLRRDLSTFSKVETLAFPYYSRKIHNPIQNAVSCDQNKTILIIEGLWILYNEKPWSELEIFFDYKIFFQTLPEFRKKNTIERHMRGGRSFENSVAFYEKSDLENDNLITRKIVPYDIIFSVE